MVFLHLAAMVVLELKAQQLVLDRNPVAAVVAQVLELLALVALVKSSSQFSRRKE